METPKIILGKEYKIVGKNIVGTAVHAGLIVDRLCVIIDCGHGKLIREWATNLVEFTRTIR